MSIQTQRILFEDDTTEYDLSVSLNDFRGSTEVLPFVNGDDYLYIGSEHPFNQRYIDLSVVNDQASVVSVDIWWASDWKAAVDVVDRTAVSGVTLAQSGIIEFRPNRLYGWHRELDSNTVTGITAEHLYNLYWIRLNFSADLNANTALNYMGHRFADDSKLFDLYPDLNNSALFTAFESGKTDWNEQHFIAAEKIISDLKKNQVIWSADQILDHRLLEEAAIHKCAELIYRGLEREADVVVEVNNEYNKAMNFTFPRIDRNTDGALSESEKRKITGFMRR